MIDYVYYVRIIESICIAFIPHKDFNLFRFLQQITYMNIKTIRDALQHIQSR